MDDAIKLFMDKIRIQYIFIENEESRKKIHDLLINDIIHNPTEPIECIYFGLYYELVKKDYVSAEKYYLLGAETGDAQAIFYLGAYYNDREDYDQMKFYYLMAIEKGDMGAMNNLGHHYQHKEINYDKMKYYHLMAIEQGESNAMHNLGCYYQSIEKDYDKAKYYYLMAVEKGNKYAMGSLGWYYRKIFNYEKMEEYCLMAIKNGNKHTFDQLMCEYMYNYSHMKQLILLTSYPSMAKREDIINTFNFVSSTKLNADDQNKFFELFTEFQFNDDDELFPSLRLLLNSINNQLSIMDLHFTYTVNGLGYNDAKSDFFDKCTGK